MKRSIHILEKGTHTSVQDLGRAGHRSSGIAAGGAIDPVSMRIANLLVGNPPGSACLECALVGPTLRFDCDCTIAACGARSNALPEAKTIRVRAGQTIALGPLRDFAYAYLAIAGGIDVPAVLGSRSTDTRVGIGGLEGRCLRAGDVIRVGVEPPSRGPSVRVNARSLLEGDVPIRLLRGADTQRIAGDWIAQMYKVSSHSNRMGGLLEGPPIRINAPADRESSIILPGTIQLPPDGRPIVLLADAQTLGGYPQIGHVIEADLPRFAQRRPGTEVRFEWCSIEEAHRLLRQRERKLALLHYALGLEG